MNIVDPMSKVKAGLITEGQGDNEVVLASAHIRAKLRDLAAEV